MTTDNFYASLNSLDKFSDLMELGHYTALPNDWLVVVTDIADSTLAIQAGDYKAVNITGVSVITSIQNALKPLELPYIFGGDGASLCVPAAYKEAVEAALLATQAMAKKEFKLDLRVGIFPVSEIRAAGFDVLVAKQQVSQHYQQAAFAGGGLQFAEDNLKNLPEAQINSDDKDEIPEADFSGLECRWNNIPSKHEGIVTFIVSACSKEEDSRHIFYREFNEYLKTVYGDVTSSSPVYAAGLKATLKNSQLRYEGKVRTHGQGFFSSLLYRIRLPIFNYIGHVFMKNATQRDGIDWGAYKSDLVKNADCRKFDGVLRYVLSGTAAQREKLTNYIDAKHQAGDCVYGLHVSDSALITCLLQNRNGAHFHFIDGANGGYAEAALQMKQQLKLQMKQ